MNSIKNRHFEKPTEENSWQYAPTATCRICGEKVSLSPEELITHLREIGEGTFVCPMCRHLMSEAEMDGIKPKDENCELPEDLFEQILALITELMINRIMEDERNDSDETESDSDEAAAACAECGSANPPESSGLDTAECGGSGFSFQAKLFLQTVVHLNFQVQDMTL